MLQHITDLCPNISLALISDRMRIKKSQTITAQECVSLNSDVIVYQQGDSYSNRFAPLDDADLKHVRNLGKEKDSTAKSSYSELEMMRAKLSFSLYKYIASSGPGPDSFKGARWVWSFAKLTLGATTEAFLAAWSWNSLLFLAIGRISYTEESCTFALERPFRIQMAVDVLRDIEIFEHEKETKKRKRETVLHLEKLSARWCFSNLHTCAVDFEAVEVVEISSEIARADRKARKSDADDPPIADADETHVTHASDDVAAELSRIIKADGYGAEDPDDSNGASCMDDKDAEKAEEFDDHGCEISEERYVEEPEPCGDGVGSVGPQEDNTHTDEIEEAVAKTVSDKKRALADAHARAEACKEVLLTKGMISLVANAEEVCFVRWTEPWNRRGRRLSCDTYNRN